jgi:gamma-glutamyltranspeptidase/glutathione hydrolase
MISLRTTFAAFAALALASCAGSMPQGSAPTAPSPVAQVPAPREMFVIAANPLASEAGMAVLKRGGSAVDAAAAVQAMLSLVEPQSSGIGGGAFMTYFNAMTGKVEVYDGREVAPAGATPDMFLDDSGRPLNFATAVVSGRATGVPGVVRLLGVTHAAYGKLPWRSLFGDAERVARAGFIVSPRLGRMLKGGFPQLRAPDARAYFGKGDGNLVGPGDRLKNPAYAQFLRRLAAKGPDALYTGETAQRIVARTTSGDLPGTMTLADLAAYRPVKRDPLCRDWRIYSICVPPPPSSGVGLIQLMMLLDTTDIATRGPADPQAWYLFAQASRIMYADRDTYVGDVANVPVQGMLDPAYVASRARLIGESAGEPPVAGAPAGAAIAARDTTLEPVGTSHFIVGDAAGNVVSMTTTVESIFGSGRMVDGFFLNNQMTDFAFSPRDAQGRISPNAIAPGKRPRSSMTPLILLDRDGRFAGALGSAGGNSILAYVGKSLLASAVWGMKMQDALALPNLVARGPVFNGEVTKFSPEIQSALAARGVRLVPGQGEDSGLQGVMIRDGRVDGGYDPRREGRVLTAPVPGSR